MTVRPTSEVPASGDERSGAKPVEDDVREHVAGVEDRVEERVDELVAHRLDDRLDDVTGEAVRAAEQADASAGRAEQARNAAQQAGHDAAEAGHVAVKAASRVAPDDPLLDTAVRRIEARATPDQPFGRLGRPMSGRSPFRIAFTGSLGVAVAYALVQSVIAVRSVLILLLVSAFLAIGLDPAVQALERHGLPRGRAVGVVLLGVLLCFAGFGLAVIPPVIEQGQQFVASVPGYIDELQSNDRIAELDRRYGLLDRAQTYLARPERLGERAVGGVLGVGLVVLNAFFGTLTVLILTLYFLSSLPVIKANAYRMVPRSRRPRVGLLTDEILARVGGYVAGALTIAGIAGGLTFLVLVLLEIPYPVALAMLVGVTALVPLIGATVGATVIIVVAAFVSTKTAIVVAVYYLVYQQVENYYLYPRIMKRSVDVSPAATVVAVLVGGSLLGVLGALLAIPIAAAIQLVLQEVVAPRQDRL